ncbi:MAG: polysaccharide deacetylase family protein [bacterium]
MKFKFEISYRIKIICAAVWGVYILASLSQGAGTFYGSGSTNLKQIAFSFDDGPGHATDEILSILKQYDIQAVFFMLGSNVKKHPEIAKNVLAEGHEVASHAYSHVNLYKYKDTIPRGILDKELHLSAETIYQATGYQVRYVRIPHGYYRPWVREAALAQNVDIVHWTFGCDWEKMDAKEMIDAYVDAAKPGAILLFHDGGGTKQRQKTILILPIIIEKIIKKGYTIVPIDQLINPHNENKEGK